MRKKQNRKSRLTFRAKHLHNHSFLRHWLNWRSCLQSERLAAGRLQLRAWARAQATARSAICCYMEQVIWRVIYFDCSWSFCWQKGDWASESCDSSLILLWSFDAGCEETMISKKNKDTSNCLTFNRLRFRNSDVGNVVIRLDSKQIKNCKRFINNLI